MNKMFPEFRLARHFLLLAVSGLLLLPGLILAQEEEEEEEEEAATAVGAELDWREQRAELEKKISERVEQILAEQITPERTIKFINLNISRGKNIPGLGDFANLRGTQWTWDPEKGGIPSKTREIIEISQEVDRESHEKATKKFPDSYRKTFEKDADEIYKMYKKNEKVSITLREGYGANTLAEGYFRNMDSERVQLNSRYIPRSDLDELTEARFYPDVNEKQKAEYIRKENEKYDSKIENFIYETNRLEMPKRFLEANFVPEIDKEGASIRTGKYEFWKEKKLVYQQVYDGLRRIIREKITPEITKQVFEQNDPPYVRALNENDEEEWMPQSVADQIKAEKEQAANPNDDPNMMMDPGMMMPNGMPQGRPNPRPMPNR